MAGEGKKKMSKGSDTRKLEFHSNQEFHVIMHPIRFITLATFRNKMLMLIVNQVHFKMIIVSRRSTRNQEFSITLTL